MMIIEVHDTKVKVKKGVSARNNREYEIHEQTAWAKFPTKPHPVEITFALEDGGKPYPVGRYTIDYADTLYVDRFNNLKLGTLSLTPIASEVKQAS